MSQQKQPRQDDYVIFRSGGLAHFRAGDTPPHLFVLWIIALLATVLGLVAANGALSEGAVSDPGLLLLSGCLLFLGLSSFVAAVAVGAVLHAVGAVLHSLQPGEAASPQAAGSDMPAA